MRLILRIHERLADRFCWIQYPKPAAYFPRVTLWWRFQQLSSAQKGWTVFAIFWSTLIALAIIGNLLF